MLRSRETQNARWQHATTQLPPVLLPAFPARARRDCLCSRLHKPAVKVTKASISSKLSGSMKMQHMNDLSLIELLHVRHSLQAWAIIEPILGILYCQWYAMCLSIVFLQTGNRKYESCHSLSTTAAALPLASGTHASSHASSSSSVSSGTLVCWGLATVGLQAERTDGRTPLKAVSVHPCDLMMINSQW
jgi:hypothetical protein